MSTLSDDGTLIPIQDDIAKQMHYAMTLHNNGELETAEGIYREVLTRDPDNADALHLLGFLACQVGFPDEGIPLIEQAIELNPKETLYLNNLANIFIDLDESKKAEAAYRQSLSIDGQSAAVLNDLGNLLRSVKPTTPKRLNEAERLVRKAVRLDKLNPNYHNNLGNILRDLGNFKLAEVCYQKALKIDPNMGGVYCNLGILAHHHDNYDESIELYQRALELNPADAKAHNNLADVYAFQQKLELAIQHYEKAIEFDNNTSLIYLNLGSALMRRRRFVEALDALSQAMILYPDEMMSYIKFAQVLRLMDRLDESEQFAKDALKIEPENAALKSALALVYLDRHDYDRAEKIFREILLTHPDSANCLNNLAVILNSQEQYKESFEFFDKALALEKNDPGQHWNYSLALLSVGELDRGWQEYEWRYKSDNFPSAVRSYPCPQWDGSPLKGKKIFLWAEQGLGDEIRYASMINEVIAMGADITIDCSERLVDLFARSFKGTHVFKSPYEVADTGNETFDFHCPFPSLAMHFRNSLDTFPTDANNYLVPDPERVAFWRARFDAMGPKPKIGIVWRSLYMTEDRLAFYANIKELEPFLTMPGIDVINLQYDVNDEELNEAVERFGTTMHDWDDIDQRNELDELTAMLANLDLVITCPSVVGEMSAAVGVQTFEFFAENAHFVMLGQGIGKNEHTCIWHPKLQYFTKALHDPMGPLLERIAQATRQRFNIPSS